MSAEESRRITDKIYNKTNFIKNIKNDIEKTANSGSYELVKKIKKENLSCGKLNNFFNYLKNLNYNFNIFCPSYRDTNTISINWIKNEKIIQKELKHIYF